MKSNSLLNLISKKENEKLINITQVDKYID